MGRSQLVVMWVVRALYKVARGCRHEISYLHQNSSYYPRVWRECTLNRCPLMPYNRRYGPQPIGGGVGSAGPVQGGPGGANHISTKTWPIAFALVASVSLIGAH
jgi:hypothetical protein